MHELVTTAAILSLTIACHIVIWRLWQPRRDTVALLAICGGTIGAIVAAWGIGIWPFGPDTLPGWIQVGLAVAAVWLGYCEFYLAVKSQSPSSQMLLYAARHPQGVLPKDLMAVVADGPAEDERVESLMNAGLVRRTDVGLEPTPTGRRLAQAISIVGGIYRLPPPGPEPGSQE